jgi:hypothetical protein
MTEHVLDGMGSQINPRERAAVDAWIASGAAAHSMLDAPEHADWLMQGETIPFPTTSR